MASERGIYALTRREGGESRTFYGQFHVLFKKQAGVWQILMDYDSDEGGSIGETQFLEAHPIDDLEPFLKEE